MDGLYHIVTINGRTACSGLSTADGYTVWIDRPAGTHVDVSIKDPRNDKIITVKKDFIVPLRKMTFEIQAPFAKHKIKLNIFEGEVGDYLRKTHKVQKGETLSSIASHYGLNWTQIAQLNNLKDPYKIKVGDILKLPPKNASQQNTNQTSSRSTTTPQSQDTYKVKRGDTLSGISQSSGVSVSELQRINGISDPKKLQYGQSIKLREENSNNSSADNTSGAAREETGFFDGIQDTVVGAVKSIKEGFEDFNNAISGTKEGESADSPRPFENQSSTNQSIYIVKRGDTLSKIAEQHGVSFNDLVKKNNLDPKAYILSGQKLKIPSQSSSGATPTSGTSSTKATPTSKPVKTEVADKRGQSGTPKVDVTKLGDCSCNRDLTLSELEEMINTLRKSENISTNDLFYFSYCTLPEEQKTYSALLNELNKIFKKHDISTCVRRIHFLAQLYHESHRFRTTIEKSNGRKYDPDVRSDAPKYGNTEIGDGPKYKGRGLIQLTWKNNYKLYKNYSNLDIVSNYTMVDTSLAISCDVSAWFWKQGKELSSGKEWRGYPKTHIESNGNNYHTINMNLIADDINNSLDENTKTITFLINGGYSHLDERQTYVKQIAELFKYPSKCISTSVAKPTVQTSGVWYEPVENPLCTLYMQSGGGGMFGKHWGLFGTTRDGHVHQGVDLFAPIGTEVRACVHAEVYEVKWHSGYGNTVTLKVINNDDFYHHRRDYNLKYGDQGEIIQGPLFNKKDNIFLFYAHLDEVLVKKGGPKVNAGTVIAKSGVSGIKKGTCAPHLHFEIFTTKYAVGMGLKYRCNPGFYVHYKTYGDMSEEEISLQKNTAKTRHT